MTLFIKPQIDWFTNQPAFGIRNYMKSEYDAISNESEMIEFIQKWSIDMETTVNPHRKASIKPIVYGLYNHVTGVSYESKIIA